MFTAGAIHKPCLKKVKLRRAAVALQAAREFAESEYLPFGKPAEIRENGNGLSPMVADPIHRKENRASVYAMRPVQQRIPRTAHLPADCI